MPKELIELVKEYGAACYRKGFCGARNNALDYKTETEKADELLKRIEEVVNQDDALMRV